MIRVTLRGTVPGNGYKGRAHTQRIIVRVGSGDEIPTIDLHRWFDEAGIGSEFGIEVVGLSVRRIEENAEERSDIVPLDPRGSSIDIDGRVEAVLSDDYCPLRVDFGGGTPRMRVGGQETVDAGDWIVIPAARL